ncbi:hypothetical protein EV385_3039 [Krasilnikovia cinnamomea]|uniref:Uncharacterized protein n=1 Tax=Krasilnikovia cinnamomea TaxID=349313 RepID=A0A4Q7ZJZ4_9ACTN|nr:hypothetical protein [Krasilnikovia cinnamomea]RZU51230.1 hypothetical protein EV385_3039 [Krasilnikovia cinnamomea]
MDPAFAREALQTSDAAAAAARRRGQGGAVVYLVLGLAVTLVVALLGGPLLAGRGGGFVIVMLLALVPLMTATVYSASRSATPRHSRSANAALLGLAAVLLSVTLTVGDAIFPSSYAWWTGGAVLTGLAVAVCGARELSQWHAESGAGG